MAKARAIAERRKTVDNIKKITRTMQLIATARFQQALSRATGTKPYTEKISELVEQVSTSGAAADHPLIRQNQGTGRAALLLITSNRGLCGGYNANLLREAMTVARNDETANRSTSLYVVGKKGVNYYRFLGREITRSYPELPDAPNFTQIEPIASAFMQAYENGECDTVRVTYTRFLTAARQQAETIQLLPIQQIKPESETSGDSRAEVQYEFSPEPTQLLRELLPVTVKVRLLQCFSDAVVSENVARMVAMKSASDAASEMSRMLGQQYNRARQSQITTELLDIMGGVEALK